MTLLEFARGPALEWALIIFLAGIAFRLASIFLFTKNKPLSAPRGNATTAGYRTIFSRMIPAAIFRKRLNAAFISSTIWHLGFVIVLLFLTPHILFFEGLFGISWPGIANSLVMPIAGFTLVLLILAFIRRLKHPVLKKISGLGDYLTLIITALPLISGLMASGHLGLRYETMLAIHFLSVSLFLVWFPFSKLMHVILFIPSRKRLGEKLGHKGVKA
jgi:nitrate reductase gamma subunit